MRHLVYPSAKDICLAICSEKPKPAGDFNELVPLAEKFHSLENTEEKIMCLLGQGEKLDVSQKERYIVLVGCAGINLTITFPMQIKKDFLLPDSN